MLKLDIGVTTNLYTNYLKKIPKHSELCKPPVVKKVVDAVRRVDEVTEIVWCLFVLSTDQDLCVWLLDYGIIETSFTILEKLINEQVSQVHYGMYSIEQMVAW